MKQILALLLLLALFPTIVLAQSGSGAETEVRGYAVYLWPGADQPWTEAVGGELQWARWINPHFGWALALGLQNWNADYEGDDTYVDPIFGFPIPMHHQVTGDALNIPMGGSVLGRLPLGPMKLTGELGVRFVPVIPDIRYQVSMPDPENPLVQLTLNQDVTIKPPIIAVAGLDLEYPLNDDYALYVGGGYQYDLLQPEIEIDLPVLMGGGTRTESNQMKAWFARVGCTRRF